MTGVQTCALPICFPVTIRGAEVNRIWKKGDKVEFVMDMTVKLLESNPLVEETRNQTVVKRGPLVYCLESIDIEGGQPIDDVLIPADIQLTRRRSPSTAVR